MLSVRAGLIAFRHTCVSLDVVLQVDLAACRSSVLQESGTLAVTHARVCQWPEVSVLRSACLAGWQTISPSTKPLQATFPVWISGEITDPPLAKMVANTPRTCSPLKPSQSLASKRQTRRQRHCSCCSAIRHRIHRTSNGLRWCVRGEGCGG